jgi:hypothetical protein
LNEVSSAIQSTIDANSYNIQQLFLENYYDGKSTPYTAMFFDALSDTAKMDLTTSTLTGDANSAQADVAVTDGSLFTAGQEVLVGDNNAQEFNTIASIATNTLTMDNNLANTYTTADSGAVDRTSTVRTGSGFDSYVLPSGSNNIFKALYASLIQEFQTTFAGATMWLTRTTPDKQLMDLAMAPAATTIEVIGDQTDIYATGDTVDLSTPDNLTRERGVLSGTTFTGSVSTVSIDVNTIRASSGNNTGFSYSHTCAVGATDLIVTVWCTNSQLTITGVTYNAVAMTQIAFFNTGVQGGQAVYKLSNPASGTNTVTVTAPDSRDRFASSISFFNTNGVDKVTSGTTTTTAPFTVSLTPNVDKTYIVAWKATSSTAETLTTGQSIISSINGSTGKGPFETIDAGIKTPIAIETFTWTYAGGHDLGATIVAMAPQITGNTELELTAGVTNSWTVADFVERVGAFPKLSIVPNGNDELPESPVYQSSIVDFSQSPERTEDEYSFTPTASGEDAEILVELTRNRTDQGIRLYKPGVTYHE